MTKKITIVSGLPRSGTSLCMKMLEAGGMEVVVDNIRKPDVDNPKGYYEYEIVKKIKEDTSWLPHTQGKVFKMVSMLLYHLPQDYEYKIVFMKREMVEILASQAKMIKRLKTNRANANDQKMAALFAKHLTEIEEWLNHKKAMDVLYLGYNDVIENPSENVMRLEQFLEQPLDTEKMTAVVDSSLYRNRI